MDTADYSLAELRGISFNKCSSALLLGFLVVWPFFVNTKEGCLKLLSASQFSIGIKHDLLGSDMS